MTLWGGRLTALVDAMDAAAKRRASAADATAPELASVLAVLRADHAASADVTDDADTADTGADAFVQLAEVLGLGELDVGLLLVAGAAEIDANAGLAYRLLGGTTSGRPSVGLALELCGVPSASAVVRARLNEWAPLRRCDLVRVVGDGPYLGRALAATDRAVAFLLGDATPDPLVAPLLREPVPAPVATDHAVVRALDDGVELVWVRVPGAADGTAFAVGAFAALDVGCTVVDLRRADRSDGSPPVRDVVRAVVREAVLTATALVVAGADVIADDPDPVAFELLAGAAVPVICIAKADWDARWLGWVPLVVDAPTTTIRDRVAVWDAVFPAKTWSAAEEAQLSSVPIAPEDIPAAARHAELVAGATGEPLTIESLRSAARRFGRHRARRGRGPRATATFADLLLPAAAAAELQRLVDWARHREDVLATGLLPGPSGKGAGLTALFSGSPGTGKTLAASVVAEELALDLYQVDLPGVVDKYVGETEKNLERVFAEAESLNVVLFFDEADSLFGSRSEVRDSRDRYANLEVSYLLQRMEQFDGIVILATNLRGNLDPAFSRRLNFLVHFPDPDEPTRLRLWQHHLAAVRELDGDDPVDVKALARTAEIAGGDIRNIVLAAAFDAISAGEPLGHRHIAAAATREYGKLGRRVPPGGFA